MEKIIYALWDADADQLLDGLAERLPDEASNLRLNLQDQDVAAGKGLIQSRGDALPNALVQLWLPSANPIFRSETDNVIAEYCSSCHAWLIAESAIIPNEKYPPRLGKRTEGFSQMAFLTLPEKLDWQQWRAIWRDYHTRIAIDTQSNFEYIQNLVVEPLTEDAPPYIAIVEECFPVEALTNPLVFFDAVDDQEKFEKNLATMMDSVGRFIDPGTIDVFPTSQYDLS